MFPAATSGHNRGVTPIEQFRLCWDHVNDLMSRRQKVTATYLTVNSAVIGALAYMLKGAHPLTLGQQIAMVLLMVAGMVACGLWRRLVVRYSAFLDWWYGELRELEQAHPELGGIINREYAAFYERGQKSAITQKHPRLYLTSYETRLSWLFTGTYIVFSAILLGLIALELRTWL